MPRDEAVTPRIFFSRYAAAAKILIRRHTLLRQWGSLPRQLLRCYIVITPLLLRRLHIIVITPLRLRLRHTISYHYDSHITMIYTVVEAAWYTVALLSY